MDNELKRKLYVAIASGTAEEVQAAMDAVGGWYNLSPQEKDTAVAQFSSSWASKDRADVLEVMIKNDVDKESVFYDETFLMYSARSGYVNCVKKLIELGVNMDYAPLSQNGNALVAVLKESNNLPKETVSEIVDILIENGIDVDGNTTGYTPLMLAVKQGNVGLVERLICSGADVNNWNRDNESALTVAKREKQTEIADILRKAGAFDHAASVALIEAVKDEEVDEEKIARIIYNDADMNYMGSEALRLATHYGYKNIVTRLLNHGADVNGEKYDGTTALMWAKKEDVEMMSLLLDRDANIDAVDNEGFTTLHRLVRFYVDEEILPAIHMLLDRGASVDIKNEKGNTALMTVVSNVGPGRLDAAAALLEHGANPNEAGEKGVTPLLRAFERRDTELGAILVKYGAKADIADENGKTALDKAISYHSADMVDMAIAAGATIDPAKLDDIAREVTGMMSYDTINQALQKEMRKEKNDNMVKLLIALGADVNMPDENGMTPLEVAVSLNRAEIIDSLIQHGADKNAQNKAGKTAMHIAAQYGKMESMDVLMNHEADLDIRDAEGKTPLHTSVQYGKSDSLNKLIKAGADLFIRDAKGQTALGMARAQHVQQALRVAGAGNIFKRAQSKFAYWRRSENTRQ